MWVRERAMDTMMRGTGKHERREIVDTMMDKFLATMTTREKQEVMTGLVSRVVGSVGDSQPEGLRRVMVRVFPDMIRAWMESVGSEEVTEAMREIMPRMMENCLAPMGKRDRERMLAFCLSMLWEIEEKFLEGGTRAERPHRGRIVPP